MPDILVVTPNDLSTDFELGTRTAGKITVVRATSSVAGVVTLSDIAAIASSNAGNPATTSTLGVVRIGAGLLVNNGIVSFNANAVAITGGSINGVTIGAGNAAPGNFTTLSSLNQATLSSIISGSIDATDLTITGSANFAALTATGAAHLLGNVILGDNSTDAVVINGTLTMGTGTYSSFIASTSVSSFQLPQGTTAQRAGMPGSIRLNTTLNDFEGTKDGTVWAPLSGGPTGGGNDKLFGLNGNVVTTNYAIPPGKNAVTAGPVTINNGITVTIPTGSGWSVV